MGARYVTANALRFAYVAQGPEKGPLALCLHGFPDTPATWRHLLPALAAAGFRAVAPWIRGYAPTQLPPDGDYDRETLARDANALHDVLGGDERAVLVGHDWGAVASYRAAAAAPERWRGVVTLGVTPDEVRFMRRSPRQLLQSWYVGVLSLPGSEAVVRRDDFAFIEQLWRSWSPGYQMQEADRAPLWAALRSPGSLDAMLGYYRALRLPAVTPSDPRTITLPTQPLLYLHGREDGCVLPRVFLEARECLDGAAGQEARLLAGVGHFLHLERPDWINGQILDFVQALGP